MRAMLSGVLRQDSLPLGLAALSSQMVAFVLIGAGAALSFVLVSSALVGVNTGLPAWVVSALCYAAFVVPVYLLHRRFTFVSDTRHAFAFPRYVAVQISGVTLALLFSYLAYTVFGLPALLASAAVTVLTSGVNFAVLKLWAFSDPL